jgi:hypothetical protein
MKRHRIALAVLALVAVGLLALVLSYGRSDGLDAFPHAFVRAPTYDQGMVEFVIAPIASPPTPPDGMLPAFWCDDPAFNDRQGRVWIFPLMAAGMSEPQAPVHPVLKRRPAAAACRPLLNEQALAMLQDFKQRMSQ